MSCLLALLILSGLSLVGAEEAGVTLSISAPVSQQVFQRDAQDHADIRLCGSVNSGVDVVEAKAELLPGATRGNGTDWVVIAKIGQIAREGGFAGTLSLQAGGWYKLAAAHEQRRIKRQQMRKNGLLTTDTQDAILPAAGEAEASVAGEHLARNSRPGCDGHPSGGVGQTGSPTLHVAQKDIQSIPHAFLNSDLPEASRHLNGKSDLSNSR